MSKNKIKRDIISEQEFNLQAQGASMSPLDDSPGDSEESAGAEFLMGLNYMPDEKNELGGEGNEPGEIIFADVKSTASGETPNGAKSAERKSRIPESAKVVSSEVASPWADLDTASDTH